MIHRLFKAGSANSTVGTEIDGRVDDTITGIVLELTATGSADGDQFAAELTWLSSPQFDENDTNGTIHVLKFNVEGTAARLADRIFIPMNEPWNAGERLYLNVKSTGTGIATGECFVHTASKLTNRPATRRR